MKKILITGANGFIANELINKLLSEKISIIAQSRSRVDLDCPAIRCSLTDALSKELMAQEDLSGIIHLAAEANVSYCEEHKMESHAVNVDASIMLASIAKEKQIPFVFASTDLVYDGCKGMYTPFDKPNPLMEYGKQKLEAEKQIKALYPSAKIMRLSLVLGERGGYEKHLVEQLRAEKEQFLFTDEIRQAISVEDVCTHLFNALQWQGGIYLIGGNKALNRYEIGKQIAEKHLLNLDLLKPCLQEEVNMKIPRPKNLSFDL